MAIAGLRGEHDVPGAVIGPRPDSPGPRVGSAGRSDRGESRRGYWGQIYFANEENGDEGRVFGVLPDGTTQQLPRLGLASWENTKPAYNRSDTTLTVGNEDGAAGQVHIYEGVKRHRGSAFDRAGLTNGVAAVYFIFAAHVDWGPAGIIAVTSILGAQLGARYGRRLPPAALRALIVVVGVTAIVRLLVA